MSARDTKYRAENPDKIWKSKYKATDEQYAHYLGVIACECCNKTLASGRSKDKCQDHNHQTGELRGVICQSCNTAEGHASTPERAYQVACYMASNTPLNELIKGL